MKQRAPVRAQVAPNRLCAAPEQPLAFAMLFPARATWMGQYVLHSTEQGQLRLPLKRNPASGAAGGAPCGTNVLAGLLQQIGAVPAKPDRLILSIQGLNHQAEPELDKTRFPTATIHHSPRHEPKALVCAPRYRPDTAPTKPRPGVPTDRAANRNQARCPESIHGSRSGSHSSVQTYPSGASAHPTVGPIAPRS